MLEGKTKLGGDAEENLREKWKTGKSDEEDNPIAAKGLDKVSPVLSTPTQHPGGRYTPDYHGRRLISIKN